MAVGIAMNISSPISASSPFCSDWSTPYVAGKALTTSEQGMAVLGVTVASNKRTALQGSALEGQ